MVRSVWRTVGIETRHQNQLLVCMPHTGNDHKTSESKPLLVGFDDCSLDTAVFLFVLQQPATWTRHFHGIFHEKDTDISFSTAWQTQQRGDNLTTDQGQYMVLFLSIHTRTFSCVLFGTTVVDSDQFSSFIVSFTALCWISVWPILPEWKTRYFTCNCH